MSTPDTTRLEQEQAIINMLVISLGRENPPPTRELVEERAKVLAAMQGYREDLTHIVEEVLIAIDTRVGRGEAIVDSKSPHDRDWAKKREIKWTYSDAYEKYLTLGGWAPDAVQAISDTSDRILGLLQDPQSEGTWDRRGLVIGHVQSGKTANYLELVTRSADAGYKFIIVIAGIHNNLRRQTQERMDAGFIGRSSDPERRKDNIGVSCYIRDYPHPVTLTTLTNDFNKNTATQSGWKINDFSKPIVLVIKKNVTTLKSLYNWLKDLNAKNGKISDVPMIMLDDEADNASINTNNDETNPTKTNAWLRKILGLFAKSCYVGYTATPFANIFINPDAYDSEVFDDLFPRDFIYSLDAPNTYFGPDKVFLDEDTGRKTLRIIDDCEEYIPLKHKKYYDIKELPPSLYKAFNTFVLIRTIRNCRGQQNRHCSMLVNVSIFIGIQNKVKNLLTIHKRKLQEAVMANYGMSESSSSKNKYMQDLKSIYDEEFSDCGFSWNAVKSKLPSAFETLELFVINSGKSGDSLDYKKYEQDGAGLTAVAVGGFSLSRGLTLEGLCVSYMHRNTRMYDTLMQMGRWFGYRFGFEDLCRIWLTEESIEWYGYIADKTNELRQQIHMMRRDNMTPREFGLYVEKHPDKLLITSANKMRSATMMDVEMSYSGRLVESYKLPTDSGINARNEELIREYWQKGFGGNVEKTGKGWWINDVDCAVIVEFLRKFQVTRSFGEQKRAALEYLREISDQWPKGDVLLISVAKNGEDGDSYKLGCQLRSAKRERLEDVNHESDTVWRTPKDRVASRGDEKLGLTKEQQEDAQKLAEEDFGREPDETCKPSDVHYRKIRNKPLLMLHVLELPDPDFARVPAFGISFPFGDYGRTIRIAANKVWVDTHRTAMEPEEKEELAEEEQDG